MIRVHMDTEIVERLSNRIFRDHKSIGPVMLDRNTADLNMPDGNININSAASLDFEF